MTRTEARMKTDFAFFSQGAKKSGAKDSKFAGSLEITSAFA